LETILHQKKEGKVDGPILGTFSTKYRHRPWRTGFTLELNTKREVKAEVAVDDVAGVDGLSATFTLQETAGKLATDPQQLFTTTGLEYRHENLALKTSVDFGKSDGSTILIGGVTGTNGFLLGASANYHTGTSELKELNTVVSYAQPDYDVSIYGKMGTKDDKQTSEAGVKYFHKVTNDLSVAADVNADVNNTSKAPKLTVATHYKIDASSSVKTKFDTEGKLGLSLQQKLNPNTKLTVSTTIDANNLSGQKNSSVFGFALNFAY
jgi:hypothetical protein